MTLDDQARLTVLLSRFVTQKKASMEELVECLSLARMLDNLPGGGPALGDALFELIIRVIKRRFGSLPVEWQPSPCGNSPLHEIAKDGEPL